MTFYKLMGNRTLKTEAEQAEYFQMDVDWLLNTSQAMGFETGNIERISEEARLKIENDEPLNEKESELVGTVYVGDAEWVNPLSLWGGPRWTRYFLRFGDGPAHCKFLNIGKKYCDVGRLNFPYYSTPGDFDIESCRDFRKAALLATGVLHLEWYTYVCNQVGLEYDEELAQETKNETVEYLTGQSDSMSSRAAYFQKTMYEEDINWIDQTEKEFHFRSFLLWRTEKLMNSFIDELDNHAD